VSVAHRYATLSVLIREAASFATSGDVTEADPVAHPYFFTGSEAGPGSAAQALPPIAAITPARSHVASPASPPARPAGTRPSATARNAR
jgi:hypothetical protein